jgi:hypothetical protein
MIKDLLKKYLLEYITEADPMVHFNDRVNEVVNDIIGIQLPANVYLPNAPKETQDAWIISQLQAKLKDKINAVIATDYPIGKKGKEWYSLSYIESLIEVAIESVEDDTNSDIMDVVNVITHRIGDGGESGISTIWQIAQAPFQSFTKLETSPDGTTFTEVPATNYKVTSNNLYITLEILSTQYLILSTHLRFTYKTGYPDATRPTKLKQAALVRVTDLFDNERQGYNLNSVIENVAYRRLISKHVRNYW